MAVRIGSGKFGGRKLRTPRGETTRPLLARIKKSLFDILAPRLSGARVLDLYAGAGSFGLEALSRGAAVAVLVEESPVAGKVIAGNIRELGLQTDARLLRKDAASAAIALAAGGEEFDIVFLDPPFRNVDDAALLKMTAAVLGIGGVAILRIPRRRALLEEESGLHLVRRKDYGVSRVGFYGFDSDRE